MHCVVYFSVCFEANNFQDSSYKICKTTMQQSSAAEACTDFGGHLVDITTQEEQDYLAGVLSERNSSDVWIGLTSSTKGGPLFWSDGSSLEFKAWDILGRNENQTCIRMNNAYNYRWGDRGCNWSYGYVCELAGK